MAQENSFENFMRAMSLSKFVEYFGFYNNPSTGETEKFIPWKKQYEFLDWIDNLTDIGFLLKSRQAGGSTIASMLALKTVFDYSNIQVVVLSKDEDAATYFLAKRLMDAYSALPNIQGLSWPKVTKITQQHILFSNGSKISSSPATAIGAAGVTAKLVIFDEVALVDLNAASRGGAQEVFSTVRPVIQKAGGRMLLLSTARPGSWFNQMVEGILDGLKTDIPLFFFAASDDPTLTPEVITKLKMEYNDIEFRREFPMVPADAFLTRNGLVFKSFDPYRHVQEIDIPEYCDTYAMFDHGYAHPSVLLICRYDYITDIAYVVHEHRWLETEVSQIAKELRLIKANLPINTYWVADAAIFNRTGTGDTIADTYMRVGIPFTPSYKYRGNDPMDGSIAKMGLRFAQNKLIVFPQAPGLIKELKTWKWKLNSVRDMPEDTGDDAIDCHPKDTRISMADGTHKSINEVKKGDFVKTLSGNFEVEISESKGVKEIYELKFNGGSIKATKEHPFMTLNGWSTLDNLSGFDYVLIEKEALCQKQFNTTIETTEHIQKMENTISQEQLKTTAFQNVNSCIVKFGKIILEKYLKGITFTTKTEIEKTTQSKILNAYHLNNIQKNIQEKFAQKQSEITSISKDQKQKNGTQANKVESGIDNTPLKTDWAREIMGMDYAESVIQNIKRKLINLFFANHIAELKTENYQELIMRHENANVEHILQSINMLKNNIVLARVESITHIGSEETFNLTIPKCPEFFANGVLVHNCCKYLIAEIHIRQHKKQTEKPLPYSYAKSSKFSRMNMIGNIKSEAQNANWQLT